MLRRTLVLAFLSIPAAAHATAPMNPGGWGQLAGTVPATRAIGAAGVAVTPDGAQLLVAGGTDAFTFYGHGEGYGGLSCSAATRRPARWRRCSASAPTAATARAT